MIRTTILLFMGLVPLLSSDVSPLTVSAYEVTFTIRNAGIPVNGTISGLQANLQFDPQRIEQCSLEASIDVKTIKTGIALRDKHLQGREYFDSEKFPAITIRSQHLKSLSKNKFKGTFTVTIRDISKSIEIPFSYTRKGQSVFLKGTFSVNRLDFGVGEESMILSDIAVVSVVIEAKEEAAP